MPLYEYYCDNCSQAFEALRSIRESDSPSPCPHCGALADRIMPTTFQSMVFKGGWRQRAPFHQSSVRTGDTAKRAVARVKPKAVAQTGRPPRPKPRAPRKPPATKG